MTTESPNVFSATDKVETENAEGSKMLVAAEPTTAEGILADLVGEGKKFKTIEDLAKGKKESDAYIEQLKSELAGIRDELKNKAEASKMIEELRKELTASKDTTPMVVDSNLDIKEVVAKQLKELEERREAERRVREVSDTLISHFGDEAKAKEAITNKAKELGVNKEFLESVVVKSPTAFLSMMGVSISPQKGDEGQHGKTVVKAPGSSVNTEAMLTAGAGKSGTKVEYDKMRKENPALYWSPKIQNEIFQARKAGKY